MSYLSTGLGIAKGAAAPGTHTYTADKSST